MASSSNWFAMRVLIQRYWPLYEWMRAHLGSWKTLSCMKGHNALDGIWRLKAGGQMLSSVFHPL